MIAAQNNFIDTTHMLLQANADLNIANIFYGTALQIAQRNNSIEVCNMLRQAGAIEYTPAQRFWDTDSTQPFNLNVNNFIAPTNNQTIPQFNPALFGFLDNEPLDNVSIDNQQSLEAFIHQQDLEIFTDLHFYDFNTMQDNNMIFYPETPVDNQNILTDQPRRSERLKSKLEF